MTKESEREKLYNKVSKTFETQHRVILQFATGVGKSYIALRLINDLCKNNEEFKCLLVVAESAHKDNWEKEFIKWGFTQLLKQTIIVTYASLKKVPGQYDFVVYDEIHHLATDIRLYQALHVKSTYTLGLSATVGATRLGMLRQLYPDFAVLNYNLNRAIDSGVLPDPTVILVPLNLDTVNDNCEMVKVRGKKEKRVCIHCSYSEMSTYLNVLKYPNIELHIRCNEKQKYDSIDASINFWKNKFPN